MATNTALALASLRKPGAGAAAASLGAMWLAMATFGSSAADFGQHPERAGSALRLLLVQPNLPHGDRWNAKMQAHNLAKLTAFSERALAHESRTIDAVIWPENSLTSKIDETPALDQAIQRFVEDARTTLITGMVRSTASGSRSRYRSSVLRFEPGRGLTAAVDKERAIPFVESSRETLPRPVVEAVFGKAARWPRVEEVSGQPSLSGQFEAVATLCYEILFPGLVEARRTARSRVVLNLADDSWVVSQALSPMLTRIAVFRAIEQRLPVVRVAHGGLSALISPRGEILERLPRDAYAAKVIETGGARARQRAEVAVALLWGLPGALTYIAIASARSAPRKNRRSTCAHQDCEPGFG